MTCYKWFHANIIKNLDEINYVILETICQTDIKRNKKCEYPYTN